jgi:UDP-3-O-[3-hydroxymyristoyl] glucosamine N-acyltransferase
MKLRDIAASLGAILEPPGTDAEIIGVAPIESAQPGSITFIANPKYAPSARTTHASAIIVDLKFPAGDKPLLRARDPQLAYARVSELFFHPPRYEPGIHSTAVIDRSAKIGSNAHIGPYVVIDSDVEIGDHCTLLSHVVVYRGVKIGTNFFAHAHVSIREFCEIGDNVLLHNGVVIGSDGFGFAKDDQGHWYKVPQAGKVVIESDVEIQANSCIDRGSIGETRIGRYTKVDNLAQVGHNCIVGENGLLCAQVGLAGSTEIGKDVILAGQAGVAGHCKLGDGVVVTAQSGTHGDIPPRSIVSGSPAFDNKQWLRSVSVFSRLPELARAVRDLAAKRSKDDQGT